MYFFKVPCLYSIGPSVTLMFVCLFVFSLTRNLFISVTRSCWRSVLSCRRELMSYSESSPIAQRHPLNNQAPLHVPSLQCKPSFDTVTPVIFGEAALASQDNCVPNYLFGDSPQRLDDCICVSHKSYKVSSAVSHYFTTVILYFERTCTLCSEYCLAYQPTFGVCF